MTREVEQTRQATDDLITLLDSADRLPGARELRTRSYDLLDVEPGTSVVDVGCGTGRAWPVLTGRSLEPGPARARSRSWWS